MTDSIVLIMTSLASIVRRTLIVEGNTGFSYVEFVRIFFSEIDSFL
ncbi:MAG: hypothetical protein ABGX71_04805 [Methyloprofundus sp.]|nr:hypothetical protein [Methyloprofundus sp.]